MTRASLTATLIAAFAVLTSCGDGSQSGPLAASQPSAASYSVPLEVGKLHSLGFTLQNPSDQPMVLDAAIALDQHGPREIIATAILHHPSYIIYGHDGFPPSGVSTIAHPLKGWVVAPHENDDNLIFGVRVKKGRWSTRAVRIEYHSGNRHFVDDLPFGFATCAPLKKWLKRCNAPPLP